MGVYDDIISRFRETHNITPENQEMILNPSVNLLHDGLLMTDAQEYIDLLYSLRSKNITIDPDYDADGILSGSLLLAGLDVLNVGTTVNLYPPEAAEGYGLTPRAASSLLTRFPETEVVLTTDNGIAAFEGINELRKQNIMVLVSDHHLGKLKEPVANILVNPNRVSKEDNYPFKGLSGSGVIWKLLLEYAKQYEPLRVQAIMDLGVFVGLANITDVMPLVDENRFLTKSALIVLNNDMWLENHSYGETKYNAVFRGLYAIKKTILKNSQYDTTFDERAIGFQIGPMLNASRRMTGSSGVGFNVFISKDMQTAMLAAEHLYEVNLQRRTESNAASSAILNRLNDMDSSSFASIVEILHIKDGFAGLVAGKVCERYKLPTLVFSDYPADNILFSGDDILHLSENNGTVSGSGRAPEWCNLVEILDEVVKRNPELVSNYGGHAGAAGITVFAKNFMEFREEFDKIARVKLDAYLATGASLDAIDSATETSIMITSPAQNKEGIMVTENDFEDLLDVYNTLRRFGPFGHDFEEPIFAMRLDIDKLNVSYMGDQKQHFKLKLDNGLEIIRWNGAEEFNRSKSKTITVLARMDVNSFRGITTPQMIVEQVYFE